MLIRDEKGLYAINLDEKRNIVYETPVGFWTKEDYQQYHKDYVTKIGPKVNGKKWAMVADVKNYKTSSLGDELNVHSEWMEQAGCLCVAIIVDSAVVKMQMNRAGSGRKFEQLAFTSVEEADAWLKSKGF